MRARVIPPLLGEISAVLAVIVPAAAGAEVPSAPSRASPMTISGQIGYAYPLGTADEGTNTRDVSFGILPMSFGGNYEVRPGWSTGGRLRYAPNVPTLCASAADCVASVGRDISLSVTIDRSLARWHRLIPHLGLELGWEWLTTRLSDSGVSSSRSWNGPAGALELFVDLESQGPWTVGPAVALHAGVFVHSSLDTPAGQSSGSTSDALHAWPEISFRVGRRL